MYIYIYTLKSNSYLGGTTLNGVDVFINWKLLDLQLNLDIECVFGRSCNTSVDTWGPQKFQPLVEQLTQPLRSRRSYSRVNHPRVGMHVQVAVAATDIGSHLFQWYLGSCFEATDGGPRGELKGPNKWNLNKCLKHQYMKPPRIMCGEMCIFFFGIWMDKWCHRTAHANMVDTRLQEAVGGRSISHLAGNGSCEPRHLWLRLIQSGYT